MGIELFELDLGFMLILNVFNFFYKFSAHLFVELLKVNENNHNKYYKVAHHTTT